MYYQHQLVVCTFQWETQVHHFKKKKKGVCCFKVVDICGYFTHTVDIL